MSKIHKLIPQPELSCAVEAFNLASQSGIDPDRVLRERWAQEKREQEAREHERKMQRLLDECPGFTGGEMPRGPGLPGSVTIDPVCTKQAMDWLKRRFRVDSHAGVEATGELRIKIVARVTQKTIDGAKRPRVSFKPVEQFVLPLAG